MKQAPAPRSLDLVIDFVNTLDLEAGSDELAGDGARAWFVSRGLLDAGPGLSTLELRAAVELREALRSLMLANNGAGSAHAQAGETLERAAREGELGVAFGPDGAASLLARGVGVAGALASVLAPVAEAGADGTWRRAKACLAHDCLWAFYDRSRNRSGVWCEMAVCGNRAKVSAYRGRSRRQARR
jgi:predicted RNA-binding Zn ribbon-like protein